MIIWFPNKQYAYRASRQIEKIRHLIPYAYSSIDTFVEINDRDISRILDSLNSRCKIISLIIEKQSK